MQWNPILAHLQHSKFYIVFVSRRPSTAWNSSLVVMTHGCAIACALNQTFAQCKIFLEGTLRATLSRNTANRSGVGAVGASTHQKVWFVENPGKISENSAKTTSNETEWWNTSKNEYWHPTRQIEDRFFGGHANIFEILFGIGEIRAYFALWISLHFFLREKFVAGLAHKNFSNNFDEIREKLFRITMNFPAPTPIQPHSVLAMYVFIWISPFLTFALQTSCVFIKIETRYNAINRQNVATLLNFATDWLKIWKTSSIN